MSLGESVSFQPHLPSVWPLPQTSVTEQPLQGILLAPISIQCWAVLSSDSPFPKIFVFEAVSWLSVILVMGPHKLQAREFQQKIQAQKLNN